MQDKNKYKMTEKKQKEERVRTIWKILERKHDRPILRNECKEIKQRNSP